MKSNGISILSNRAYYYPEETGINRFSLNCKAKIRQKLRFSDNTRPSLIMIEKTK